MSAAEKSSLNTPDIQSLAIIAGRGSAPKLLVEACEKQGIDVFIVGFEGQTNSELMEGRKHMWSSLGQAGAIMKTLNEHAIKDLVLIGALPRPHLTQIKPDIKTAKFIAKIGIKAFGDSDLLSAVKEFLQDEGFRLHGIQVFAGELLTPDGVLTKTKPSKTDHIDINRGIEISQKLGGIDVGQAVIVQDGLVLAVEAIEGTSALIKRSVDLKRLDKGGVLVKTCKPQQDKDLDLPSIGPHTVELIAEAGFNGIALHARNSLILEKEEVLCKADEHKIFIIGIEI
ncbi:MAG: UDP-2,3-diacylglucosamine diphosphatase LpxI [Pseudomonadota bacterium]